MGRRGWSGINSVWGCDSTLRYTGTTAATDRGFTVSHANSRLDVSAAVTNLTFTGQVIGTGTLTKLGPGTLTLTNSTNSYTGGTTVNTGRLLVSNVSGSGTGTGAVTVNAGGTLGGTGSISGAVTVNANGHVSPGNSIESLNVGSLVLNSGSILDFELGAPGSPGINSDLINVTATGGLTLSGGSVVLTNAGGLAIGTYRLIDYIGTLGGAVANLGTPAGPAEFTYALLNNTSGTSIDLTVSAAPVSGDYNGNGVVDAADYVVWRNTLGQTGAGLPADGNANGEIDAVDWEVWRAHFGQVTGSGSAVTANAAVPEPATTVMLINLVAAAASTRRRRSA